MDNSVFQAFFALLERMLSSLNSLIKAVGLGILIAVAVLNFDVIMSGFRSLFERLPHLTKISGFGAGAEFASTPSAITKTVTECDVSTRDLRDNWKDKQSVNASEGLKSLDKRGLIRLLNIGLLHNVCEFEKANSDMRFDNASDKKLEEKQLVSPLIDNPKTTNAVRSDIRKRETAPGGKPSDIGYPVKCYDLTLTDKGQDARTAIVQSLGCRFNADRGD